MSKAIEKKDATEISIRSMITQLSTEYEYDDLNDLVDDLLKQIPPQDWRELVRPAVYTLAAQYVNIRRGDAMNPSNNGVAAKSKWVEVSDRLLESFITVPGTGRMMRLGDCGEAELTAIANYRREQADSLLDQADKFDYLAQQLRKHGKSTLRQLNKTTVTKALEDAS